MTVIALVTAGVESNARRMSRDTGDWYEPGTINIILLTNTQLSPRAMTRALITATEAKTAALQDLDIRSSVAPHHSATGTGTDNIIVVQGTGLPIDNAGGHSKMGELIAGAVHAGVQAAVFKQNGITLNRPVLRRIEERGVEVWEMAARAPCGCGSNRGELAAEAERCLMEDRYAGFLEAAMAIDDARASGRRLDLSPFAAWCRQVAADIAGRPVKAIDGMACDDPGASALQMALEAVLAGAGRKMSTQTGADTP
jgi:hypothetical protein